MRKVINNEGRTVSISEAAYNELQDALKQGVWMVYVKDVNGFLQIIPVEQLLN